MSLPPIEKEGKEMAKGYKATEQAFGQGDLAMLEGKHRVKIIEVMQDEDDSWWYEVEGIDLIPPIRMLTREVPQDALEAL